MKKQVMHILEVELADNVKAHILNADGQYVKVDKRGKVLVNSQEQFCEEAEKQLRGRKRRTQRTCLYSGGTGRG